MTEEKTGRIPGFVMPTEEELAEMRRRRRQKARENKTCQSYWHPLVPADVPVPKTALVEFPLDLHGIALNTIEEDKVTAEEAAALERGISKVKEMTDFFGYPCFIKTGIFSAKHQWYCYVKDAESVKSAVMNIVYHWALVGGFGSDDSEFFVIRELIPTKPFMLFEGKMPVTRERRYFAEDGKVFWHQPYWPKEAFERHEVDLLGHESVDAALALLNEETEEEVRRLKALAESISTAIPGAWSIDFLQDVNGKWWLIDMAEAKKSYINRNYEGGRKWLDDNKAVEQDLS